MPHEKTCFVIAPIGAEDTDIRRHSDQVLRHIIKPATELLGYATTRADEMAEPGTIPTQVIQRLVDDDLVVADLTGHNPNVFYELALRHTLRKPIVQLIRKGEKIPFDVAQNRTIEFDLRDPDNVADSKNSLVRQIEACERRPDDIDSPISIAIDIQSLRRSDNPLEASYGEITESLYEIKQMIGELRPPQGIHYPPGLFEIYNEIYELLIAINISSENLSEEVKSDLDSILPVLKHVTDLAQIGSLSIQKIERELDLTTNRKTLATQKQARQRLPSAEEIVNRMEKAKGE